VGGFSQGCAMSLLYALTSENLLGGIIGYSGHVFRSFDLKNKGTFLINSDKLPMFMYHGKNDNVINCGMAQKGYDLMIG
jgi:predicted esterase